MRVLKQDNYQVYGELQALDQILANFEQFLLPCLSHNIWFQCKLALAEGFTNAVRHAHKNLPSEIPIEIAISLSINSLEIRIWDYGPPFDLAQFLETIPNREKKLVEGGQGIPILQKIADHLSYVRTNDNRNCLLIVKQFEPVRQDAYE